jgi:hypothetical protein
LIRAAFALFLTGFQPTLATLPGFLIPPAALTLTLGEVRNIPQEAVAGSSNFKVVCKHNPVVQQIRKKMAGRPEQIKHQII